MERHEFLAPFGPAPEIVVERDAWELALEVQRIFLAIDGMVQHAVDVMKDRVLSDRRLSRRYGFVMGPELIERPVANVVNPLPTVEAESRDLLVGVDGGAKMQVGDPINGQDTVVHSGTDIAKAYSDVLGARRKHHFGRAGTIDEKRVGRERR
jgi:hypothetical protein